MNHQKADLTPWMDECIVFDSGFYLKFDDIYRPNHKEAIIANQWIRDMINEKD